MDAESEADTQRAEAGRAEVNVKREGLGSHEPARVQRNDPPRRWSIVPPAPNVGDYRLPCRPATGYGEPEAGARKPDP
jgi:hypothetical protein